ncbi:hypothetical protein [Synechocystis sp. PCC 7509]|uniref:hypothetical protein n=1 Tax=Synechocystis sp. PCC 7509 TaxID=927677 RepID=UPI0002ABA5A0|nr:hypothetical protein [Synechocystis sp. PCC 7509]
MGIRFNGLIGALALFTTVCIGSTATAQTTPINQYSQPKTLADQFEEVFFTNDKEYVENRSFLRQLDFLLGFGSFNTSFTDKEITADTEAITIFYKEALLQQGSSDRVVRTRDLPNPYNTSILRSSRPNVRRGATPTQ